MQVKIERKRKWLFRGKSSLTDHLVSWMFYPISYGGRQYVVKVKEERRQYDTYAPYRKGCLFEIYEWDGKTIVGKDPVYSASNLFFPYREGTGLYSEKMLSWSEFLQDRDGSLNNLVLTHLQDVMKSLFERFDEKMKKAKLEEKNLAAIQAWDGVVA